MTIYKCAAIVLVSVTLVGHARANWITSWGDGDPDDEWSINQFEGTITILQGNGNTYKFYAETFEGSGVPGVINNITVHQDATGDFSILIEHELGGWPTPTGWGRDSSGWNGENAAMCGGGY